MDLEIGESKCESVEEDSLDHTAKIEFVYDKDNEADEGEHIIRTFEHNMDSMRESIVENMSFTNQLYTYQDENSPLTMSVDNSDNEDEHDNSFRNLTFDEIEHNIEQSYQETDTFYSNEFDAMITFVKGQKHLFLQSNIFTQRRLHLLMLPTICISGFIAMFSTLIEESKWSGAIIAGLNGLIAILVTITNYFKMESDAHSYHLSAYQYDKLESSLEFTASKIAFLHDESQKESLILEKIQETELKINEIKEWNHIFVPNHIMNLFPMICHINICSFIKRMESNKRSLLSKFQCVKNEIRFISHQFEKQGKSINMQQRYRMERRIQVLHKTKDSMKKELFCYHNAYGYLDYLFTAEIKRAEIDGQWCSFFRRIICHTNKNADQHAIENNIVDQYVRATIYSM
jgi:hypothetical protein